MDSDFKKLMIELLARNQAIKDILFSRIHADERDFVSWQIDLLSYRYQEELGLLPEGNESVFNE